LHFPKVILNVIPLVIHYPAKIGRAGFNDYEKPRQDLYATTSKRDRQGGTYTVWFIVLVHQVIL